MNQLNSNLFSIMHTLNVKSMNFLLEKLFSQQRGYLKINKKMYDEYIKGGEPD